MMLKNTSSYCLHLAVDSCIFQINFAFDKNNHFGQEHSTPCQHAQNYVPFCLHFAKEINGHFSVILTGLLRVKYGALNKNKTTQLSEMKWILNS